jgi:hypothetical protein
VVQECAFWSNVNSTEQRYGLQHLLAKCLPQRCQVRNLNRVTKQYVSKSDEMKRTLHKILMCGMLGNYSSCSHRPAFTARRALFAQFVPEQFLVVLEKYFICIVFSMKQFIRHRIQAIDVLRTHLLQRGHWLFFEEHMDLAMEAMCLEKGAEDLIGRMALVLEQRLTRKSNRISPKKKVRKMDEVRFVWNIIGPRQLEDGVNKNFIYLHDVFCRLAIGSSIPWHLLVTMGVSRGVVRALYEGHPARDRLKLLTTEPERRTIRQFLSIYHLRNDIRLYHLPRHRCDEQRRALRRRFQLTDGAALDPALGRFVLCTQCKSIKSFCRAVDPKRGRLYGNAAVLLDEETLTYYCAHRKAHKNTPSSLTKSSVPSFFCNDAPKTKSRRKPRLDKYAFCSATPLLILPSHGFLLYFFGRLYMLCPLCAWICCLEDMAYHGSRMLCKSCQVFALT